MIHKHSENYRNCRDKPGYYLGVKNRIYQPLKKQLGKTGTQIKRNTVTVNLNSILASRKAQVLKNI